MARNPTATNTIQSTPATDTEPDVASRTTTVRMTSPMTSSATAAPRTVRDSTIASALRSPKTRGVMPTLVAVQRGTDEQCLARRRHPDDSGRTPTPADERHRRRRRLATRAATPCPTARELAEARARSPTSSSSRMTPSSASTRSTSLFSTQVRAPTGPMRMPARISPTTAGTLMRSAQLGGDLRGHEDDQDVEQRVADHRRTPGPGHGGGRRP